MIKKAILRILSIILLFAGCNNNNISEPDLSRDIKVIFKDYGCLSENLSNNILSKRSDETELNWRYSRNNLELELLYNVQCGAEHKDSVDINGKVISVFLTDTSRISALCTCLFKSTIRMNYTKQGKVGVKFYYKHLDNYFLILEKNI